VSDSIIVNGETLTSASLSLSSINTLSYSPYGLTLDGCGTHAVADAVSSFAMWGVLHAGIARDAIAGSETALRSTLQTVGEWDNELARLAQQTGGY